MIRRQYLEHLARSLRPNRLAWLAKQVYRAARLRASLGSDRAVTGPVLATVVLTYQCNLRCFMCDSWRRGDDRPTWDTAEIRRLIDTLARMGTTGLGFTGGEPLLRKDLDEILRHAVQAGPIVHLNTNGTLLTRERTERLVDTGLQSVNLSLDGAIAETHDEIRGAKGAFDKVLRAAENLLAVRSERGTGPRVHFVTVVSGKNTGEVRAALELTERAGVDGLGLLPQHARFFEAATLPASEAGQLSREIEGALASPQATKLDNSPAYLRGISPFLSGEVPENRCSAGHASLVVDAFGDVYPCVPWSETQRPVAHVTDPSELAALWYSDAYRAVRRDVAACEGCWWNCHRELDLLLRSGRREVDPVPGPTAVQVP
ncbi:MAG: radical SAM protein [Planctomycetota bacterium]